MEELKSPLALQLAALESSKLRQLHSDNERFDVQRPGSFKRLGFICACH